MPTLLCEECDLEADDDAAGWRAYLGHEPGEDEAPFVVTYCPGCRGASSTTRRTSGRRSRRAGATYPAHRGRTPVSVARGQGRPPISARAFKEPPGPTDFFGTGSPCR
jgi:hypothetical protein